MQWEGSPPIRAIKHGRRVAEEEGANVDQPLVTWRETEKKGARTHERRGPRTARRPTDATFNFGVSIMSNQDQKDYIALSTKRGLQFVQVRLCFRFPFRKKKPKTEKERLT
jgi:hypothetical protein